MKTNIQISTEATSIKNDTLHLFSAMEKNGNKNRFDHRFEIVEMYQDSDDLWMHVSIEGPWKVHDCCMTLQQKLEFIIWVVKTFENVQKEYNFPKLYFFNCDINPQYDLLISLLDILGFRPTYKRGVWVYTA